MAEMEIALVVEDDADTLGAMARVMESLDFQVVAVSTLEAARKSIVNALPTIALIDLGMPDGSGVTLIKELKTRGEVDIIVVSGTDDRNATVACLRAGVADFLQKPVSIEDMKSPIKRLRAGKAGTQVEELLSVPHGRPGFGSIFGDSDAGRRLQLDIHAAAGLDPIRLLIQGDPCAMMNDVATAIHFESGREGPVLQINCASENDDSAAERFFGRDRNSADNALEIVGYVEQASEGTLVLDDIGSLPHAIQSRLSAFIKSGEITPVDALAPRRVDCALIGLQAEPVKQAIEDGRIDEVFYYSLSLMSIKVPNLSERGRDALSFAERAVSELNFIFSMEKSLSSDFKNQIVQHDWPGNLVELRNALLTAYVTTEPYDEIPFDTAMLPASQQDSVSGMRKLVGNTFWDIERKLLLATLEHHDGNKRQTAKKLGISLKTLYNRLHAYKNKSAA